MYSSSQLFPIHIRDKQCRSVLGAGRRTQPISKLLNDLLVTSALNPIYLVQSALNPTCLLQVSDFPTHLYLGSDKRKILRRSGEGEKGRCLP
jgi:hypothetical protein